MRLAVTKIADESDFSHKSKAPAEVTWSLSEIVRHSC